MSIAECYLHFAGEPQFNMAYDDWIASRVATGNGGVIVRLYTWNTDAITIGYHQQPERAVDFSMIGTTPVIRRITGGRALLHDSSELTYSVGINLADVADRDSLSTVTGAGRFIAEILVDFLQRIGIASHVLRGSAPSTGIELDRTAPCFTSVSRYELVSGGKKIAGSAQRRFPNALFQHGSIKIYGNKGHKALGQSDNTESMEPITQKQLMDVSEHFHNAFSHRLAKEFRVMSDEMNCDSWVAERADEIQKAPLLKRLITKQEMAKASL